MYGKSGLFSFAVVREYLYFRNYSKSTSKHLLDLLAKMPKSNAVRISEAQKQRQNIAKKAKKYTPSTVYLQVLGSGARGAPSTLYLFSDQKRYLFNCGECTQRLAHEHKVRLTRLDHIFITNKSWKNIGGLPGLSLTLQDVGVPNITLHGPEGLDELYYATRRFVIMKDMNVTMASCTPEQDFEDDVMTVKYVLLPKYNILDNLKQPQKRQKVKHDKEFEEFVHDNTDYYGKCPLGKGSKSPTGLFRAGSRSPPCKESAISKTGKTLLDIQRSVDYTVAYICKLKKRLGTLDLEKCVELGVPPGPLLGQLKNGHDVLLKGGTIVHSKDVKTPDDPGPVFIVLEVPDITYLKEEEFAAHFQTPASQPENIPSLIVHFTPPHVMQLERYQNFMKSFGPSTRHLVLNSQNSCLGSEAVHRTQHRLHLLDPDIFPLLKDVSVRAEWDANPAPTNKVDSPVRSRCLEDLKNKIAIAQFQNIIRMEGRREGGEDSFAGVDVLWARTLMIHHLRPKNEVDQSAVPKLHIQEYIKSTMDIDGFGASMDKFQKLADEIRDAKTSSNADYPKVIFLGTGSCIPSKTRNTSGIALQINENNSMLMDCGEGTFGQLVRFFGPKRVNAFLRSLKAIYISHLHADHHIGLIGVIQARRQAFEEVNASELQFEPLYLLAPGQIYTWLNTYDQHFEKIKTDFTLIPNQSLLEDSQKADMTAAILASIGVERIVTCLVAHCPNAFGVAVHLPQDRKITYSGDTLPCDDLAKIGENSTLLIHEATMEDELENEARIKMHSTTSQAIEIGRKMNAKFTVLTHFSQRYARLPRLNAQILNHNTSVGIAFDNMQITLNDLPLLPYMYAPLQMMFSEHCVEMELRAAQRNTKKERREALAKRRSRKLASPPRPPLKTLKRPHSTSRCSNAVNGVSGRFTKQVLVVAQNEVIRQDAKKSNNDVRAVKASSLDRKKPTAAPGETDVSKVTIRKRCSSQEGKKLPAYYKETNSSRLRQQMKGMQVFGTLRGNSVSPSRRASCDKSEPSKADETKPAASNKEQVKKTSVFSSDKKPVTNSTNNVKTTSISKDKSKTSRNEHLSDKVTVAPINNDQEKIKIEEKKSAFTHLQTDDIDNIAKEPSRSESLIDLLKVDVIHSEYEDVHERPEMSLTIEDNFDNFDQRMKEMQAKLQARISGKQKDATDKTGAKNTNFASPFGARSAPNKFTTELLGHLEDMQKNGCKKPKEIKPRDERSKGKGESNALLARTKRGVECRRVLINSECKDSEVRLRREIPLKRKDSPMDPYQCPSAATITLSTPKTKSNSNTSRQHKKNSSEGSSGKSASSWPKENGSDYIRLFSSDNPRSTVIHIKRYEPHLEDIQSTESVTKEKHKVLKPLPFREDERKKLLDSVRRKFQSKSFREDFRFERIEGLNWISWKQ